MTFTSEVKDTKKRKQAKENERCSPIHYKMLMRSPGKAKDGECVFIRENLHHKAINFLTMGLYDLMDEQSKLDPDKIFKNCGAVSIFNFNNCCCKWIYTNSFE